MGFFEDVGDFVESAASDVGHAVESAASDVGHAVESAASDVAEAFSNADPEAVVGAVVGTVLLGPIGGVVGAAVGASPVGDAIADVIEGIPAQLADGFAEIVGGKRGLDDAIKNRTWTLGDILLGDNDRRAVTPLKPGEETTIAVTVASLAGNSNVRRIAALLAVAAAADDELPMAEETRARVSSTGSAPAAMSVQVDPPRRPRSVSIRLDGGAPFWTHPGPLTEGQYTIPDFSTAVNEFLDRGGVVGEGVQLRFLVRSDTAGRVGIVIDPRDVDATRIRLQTWTNELDRTLHADRSLTLDFAGTEEIPLTPVDAAASGRPLLTGVSMDLAGTLGSERVLGEISSVTSSESATVSAEYAVGQRTQPDASLSCTGVTACLHTTGEARLYVELQPDEGGVPAFGPPLAHAEHVVAASPGGPEWTTIAFEKPASIAPGRAYWIVVRGIEGEARLLLERGGSTFATPAAMSRGGQRWQPVAPGAGAPAVTMMRLVYLPGPETESAALDVQVHPADGASRFTTPLVRQRVDVVAATKHVDLRFTAPIERAPLTLVVRSHARGTVTLTNVTQEYTVS